MLLELISEIAKIDVRYVDKLASRSSFLYRSFKQSGRKKRLIHSPSSELKALQIILNEVFLKKLPVHKNSTAYSNGCSCYLNAKRHSSNFNYTIRIDFKNFFNSINQKDIKLYIEEEKSFNSFNEKDKELFIQLVTRKGVLPIGAPTSPILANTICFKLDEDLSAYAAERSFIYTRYSDDLCFSFNRKEDGKSITAFVKKTIVACNMPMNLKINWKKTVQRRETNGRKVTGLIVSSKKIGLGKARRKFYRSMMYHFFIKNNSDYTEGQLLGHLSYIKAVDKDFFEDLVMIYGTTILKFMGYA